MNGAKKQKLDTTSSDCTKKSPPLYGSQEYWEERYKNNHFPLENQQNEDENDGMPYHAWYFTYKELSPLILPIILGGRDEGVAILGGRRKDNVEESEHTESDEKAGKESEQADTGTKNHNPNHCNESGDEDKELEHSSIDSIEEEADDMREREGLARNGPISVIEVGCGDVPLGRDLSMELANLQAITGAKASQVVKEIVCCDYSPAVIDLCKENYLRDLQALGNGGNENSVVVEYVTADARKLPYPDCRFDLILEKGTLDAMLSDKENGQANCTLIMADCARVLKEHGESAISMT